MFEKDRAWAEFGRSAGAKPSAPRLEAKAMAAPKFDDAPNFTSRPAAAGGIDATSAR
jgi:hypothetical protein